VKAETLVLKILAKLD